MIRRKEKVKKILMFLVMCSVLTAFATVEAVPTKLMIRAKSKDAKFVGTSMGGARVVVKDSETGSILSEGLTAGSTGNSEAIMIRPRSRFGRITDSATAGFETVVDIDEPRLITIEVEAPYGMKPNMIKSSTQLWLIPGKDIIGEGVIVEVPGFSVDAAVAAKADLRGSRAVIPIQARIVMI